MYNYLQYVQSLCSPYTEQTASGLPNPTPVKGEVRFFQAQDQPSVNTHVRVGNQVFSHSLDVVSKMHIHIIYSHFFTCTLSETLFKLITHCLCCLLRCVEFSRSLTMSMHLCCQTQRPSLCYSCICSYM